MTVEAQHVAPAEQLSSTMGTRRSPRAEAPMAEPSATTAPTPTAQPLDPWRERYARRLRITDFLVLVWVVFGTQLAWFGLGNAQVSIREDSRPSEFSYWAFSAVLIVIWMLALALADPRSERVIGVGPSESARIVRASFGVFGTIAILAFLLRIDVARGYLLICCRSASSCCCSPAGCGASGLSRSARWAATPQRCCWSARASRSRRPPASCSAHPPPATAWSAHVCRRARSPTLLRAPASPSWAASTVSTAPSRSPVPTRSRSRAPTTCLPTRSSRSRGASRPASSTSFLAPSITDIAGPRMYTRPVAGLPLIHVETPRFSTGQQLTKRAVDLLLSGWA